MKPRFMSREHVALMNALLEDRLGAECAGFDRDAAVLYDVAGDPEGIRTWTVTAGPSGVRFGLDEHPAEPVVVIRASYAALATGSAAAREGHTSPDYTPEVTVHDADGYARVVAVIEAARAIATVDVEYPRR